MKRNEFLKDTEKRLRGRREALRRALAGDMSMLRTQQTSARRIVHFVSNTPDMRAIISRPNNEEQEASTQRREVGREERHS